MTYLGRIKGTHLFATYIFILPHVTELSMPRKVVSSSVESDKNMLVQTLVDKFSFTEKSKMQRKQLKKPVECGKNVEPSTNKRTSEVDENEEKTVKASKRNYTSVSSNDVNVEDINTDHSRQSEVKVENSKHVTEGTQGKKSKWEPPNWLGMLNNIREMRKTMDAPVDTMGCHKCQDDNAPAEVWFSF